MNITETGLCRRMAWVDAHGGGQFAKRCVAAALLESKQPQAEMGQRSAAIDRAQRFKMASRLRWIATFTRTDTEAEPGIRALRVAFECDFERGFCLRDVVGAKREFAE